MATLIVKHRVANFETWKKGFDGMGDSRRRHGFTGSTVHRDAGDPNLVVVINRVKDMAGAKAYGGSAELHDAMAKFGVIGAPEVLFLEDVA